MSDEEVSVPKGELAVRTLTMPGDANPNGDIFGGWVLGQMDIAGSIVAGKRARGRIVTVSVDAMAFHKPVGVGDILCCYAEVTKVGRSSMKVMVEAWVNRYTSEGREKVTEGVFTYVAVDENRRPRPVDKAGVSS